MVGIDAGSFFLILLCNQQSEVILSVAKHLVYAISQPSDNNITLRLVYRPIDEAAKV